MHDHLKMDHNHHGDNEAKTAPKEYLKLAGIIFGIILLSYISADIWGGVTIQNFIRIFMGVFFLVFGLFKLLDLRGFAMSYIGYDIIAKKVPSYAYVYPFLEIAFNNRQLN